MADPFLDALGIKDPDAKPAAAPRASNAPAKSYDPLDAAVRTVMVEAADPTERQWVAGVIANRAKADKTDFGKVVRKAGQFEPWATPEGRARIDAIDPASPEYQATAAAVLPILNGEVPDPTGGATHFYAPKVQAELAAKDGRPLKPDFDDGKGVAVGDTMFFGGKGEAPDAFLASLGVDKAKADAAPAAGAAFTGFIPFDKAKGFLNKEQSKTYEQFDKGNFIKRDQPAGSVLNPRWMTPETSEADVAPGEYFVDTKGVLTRKDGGAPESSMLKGLGQGFADIGATAAKVLPGAEDSTIGNRLLADQAAYGAQYGGDLASGAGRFTGQLLGAAPLVAGGEAALGAGLAKVGLTGLGSLLGGTAGTGEALTAGNLALRGSSLATKGAIQGGETAALVSSANPGSMGEQVAQGAVGGALLGPALPAAAAGGRWLGGTARGLIEPTTAGGRENMVNRIIGKFADGGPMTPNADEIIPGSVPTLAQATGNPGIATLERTARLSRPIPFSQRADQNAEARSLFLEGARGDEHTVADLVNTRTRLLDEMRGRAFADPSPVDGRAVATAVDEALASPEAHMEEVARPLQALRDKLVQPAAETTPAEQATFRRSVAETFGGADLTPEAMSAARSTLGKKFEEIAGKTEMAWDDKALSDVVRIISDTAQVVPESSMPPLFKQLANIASTVKDGEKITGASYQALTKKGAPLSSLQNASDPTIRDAANNIREALDDALERAVSATPEGKATLGELRDTRLAYKNLKTAEAALKSAGPDRNVTPQAVLAAVKRNFGQYAYQGGGPLGDVAETAVRQQAGRPEQVVTDPRQLFGMRESISTAIDSLEKKGTDAAHVAAERLRSVREGLDGQIEAGAPGYANYRQAAERSAEPVEATRFLQSLKLTDKVGNVTLARVDNAIKKIEEMRAKDGKNAAKSVSRVTVGQLKALREDLLREDNINKGRPLGPDTAQHLVTGNIAAKMNVPVMLGLGVAAHNPLVSAGLAMGKMFYGKKNEQVLDQLAARLLEPQQISPTVVRPNKAAGRLKKLAAPLLPGAGSIGANRLLGQ